MTKSPPQPMVIYDVDPSEPVDSPIYLRSPPWKLILNDLKLCIKHSPLILVVFSPISRFGTDITSLGLLKQVLLVVTSVILTVGSIASGVVGFPTPIVMILVIYLFIQVSNKVQDPIVLHSPGGKPGGAEEWLFVNGIGTSRSGAQLIVDRLEDLFHRPITGIHNRTYGVWFDVLQSFIQRDLLWPTDDSRLGYEILSKAVRNPDLTRIVLICHSQGGIIVGSWIDQLLDDFPHSQLKRIEIYTFASAANHFSAPGSAVFNRIEHFANEHDFVAQIGVIEFSQPTAPTTRYDEVYTNGPVPVFQERYAGRIFKRKTATGHLLLSHYLAPDNSFLDHPAVRKNSRLTTYLGGAKRL